MLLTEQKKQQTLEKLKDMWPPGKRICYVCGNNKFEVTDNIFQVSQYSRRVLVGGPVIPLIVITCTKCGNTLLFNALTLKVLQK